MYVETPNDAITPNNVETPNLGVSTNTNTNTNMETYTKTNTEMGMEINTDTDSQTETKPIKCGGKNDKWQKGVLGIVINQFKRKCTIECRKFNTTFGWQSRFYDTIIRDQESYNTISNYIINNPAKWESDKFHPSK